jgi:hypothetical protein
MWIAIIAKVERNNWWLKITIYRLGHSKSFDGTKTAQQNKTLHTLNLK